MKIDLDGIVHRVAAFPVAEGRYGRIAGVAGAKVVWNAQNIVGAHGRGGHKEAAGKLERFDFATGRTETLVEKIDDFALAGDGLSLVYRDGKALRAIAADRRPEAKPDPADADGPPSRKNGRIDLDRIRVAVEPRREWRQMLREVWRLQRDQFWSADLSGVDWDAVWRLYAPLLDRVATRADFSDLVWEMQGELGTSHAYEMGGDHRKPPAVALGHLAAATRWDDARGGWQITEIARGDPWDAIADSPLNAIGVEAKVGERIVAVDGQPLAKSLPPEALLVHRAGQKVQLALASDTATAGERRRDVVVTTLADDVPVYYRQWVEKNRAWVHERSGGRVGYFHVPDMQAAGFAEFHRYFGNECERDALIVDVRYNRGGHVSQLLLEKVARRRIAFVHSRWMNVGTYPEEAVAGPVVTLTNEHAGSDGDIFSHNVKLMKIGPLVGMRTWGGVVGIWPRHRLVDGSETTQPEFAFWFSDVGFDVENHGTDPDIEIDNAPQDAAAGRDRQLEVALQTALDCADRTAPLRAPQAARPVRARKPLPPRAVELLRLLDHAQVGLDRLVALRVLLLRVLVGDRAGDDHVLALLPVHRRRDLVLGGELHRIEDAQDLVEVAARRHRVGEHQLDLLVGADDEDRAHRRVVGGGAAVGADLVGGQHVVELGDLEVAVADHRVLDLGALASRGCPWPRRCGGRPGRPTGRSAWRCAW